MTSRVAGRPRVQAQHPTGVKEPRGDDPGWAGQLAQPLASGGLWVGVVCVCGEEGQVFRVARR
jgi:hypothetical protein